VQATETDRTGAKNLLLKSLESEARASLADELNSDEILFDETFAFSQILSENYDLPIGAAGSQLTLSMRVEYSILYADASDLTELGSLALNTSLPLGYFAPPDAVASVKSITDPILLEDGSLRWTIRVEQEIVQQVDTAFISHLIQGLGSSAAQSKLEENLPLMSEPKVLLIPSWWPWVPIVPFRIEVITQ